MAHNQTEPDVRTEGRQPITREKRPQGITKQQSQSATRKQAGYRNNSTRRHSFSFPSISNTRSIEDFSDVDQKLGRKRKRSHETKTVVLRTSLTPPLKRPRTLPLSCAVENTSNQKGKSNIDKKTQPITHWIRKGSWPKKYFKQDNQTKEGLERYTCLEDFVVKQMMTDILAKKKSSSSLRRKNSEPSLATPSDQQSREVKSSRYMTASYETILATKGSYMGRAPLATTDTSKTLCRSLLNKEQTVPQETLFRDDLFEETCDSVRGRNEAMVVRHISPLICPSLLALRIDGAKHLDFLTESINEGWNSAIAVIYSRPQPDYSVGFARSAFTDEQLEKLRPFVGEIEDYYTSYFMGTWRMYFPFLTCEVKCGAASLDVADRQNAHSMTIAVRAVVQLYRHVKREKEIHREILAFSISHNDEAVRIYGHYAVINGENTTFYRHPIRNMFSFKDLDGKEKWTAYKFTKNIYHIWMPTHIERIRSAIDHIPSGINFEVPPGNLFTSVASADESDLPDSQDMATSAPASQNTVGFKKPRLTESAMLREQLAQRDQQIMLLLKQQPPSNASATESEVALQKEKEQLQKKLDQEREESNQRLTELIKQMAQKEEERAQKEEQSNQRHRELMDLLKEQKREKDEQRQQIESLIATLVPNARPHAS